MERVDWSEGAREEFRERTEEIELGKGGVNEEWERLIERIKGAVRVKKWRRKGGDEEVGGMGSVEGERGRWRGL